MDRAEAIDGLLEKRYVLSRLDSSTIVQLLAYGPIWPVGARDYLVVTSEVDYSHALGEGFIIASTSIDDICEEEDALQGSVCSKYTRSSMRLAGYVGTPNSSGGTDLKMFVDIDVYSYVPSWLVHILAQYGLSEMMNRIRLVSIGECVGKLDVNIADFADAMRVKALAIAEGDEGDAAVEVSSANGGAPLSADEGIERAHGHVVRKRSITNPRDGRIMLLLADARRLYTAYLKGFDGTDKPLEWRERVNKQGIIVETSTITGSAWQVIKATMRLTCTPSALRALLTDDSKIGSYDDMFDKCDVIHKSSVRSSLTYCPCLYISVVAHQG